MERGSSPQHLLNLLGQLYRLRRITHMMHRNHPTARALRENRREKDSSQVQPQR